MSRALQQVGPPLDADHTPEYLRDLEELAAMFPAGAPRRQFLGDNCRELFGIEA